MKQFRFPLQQVLEVRENIEKQRQGEFVVAGQNVTEAEQVFEEMLRLQKNSIFWKCPWEVGLNFNQMRIFESKDTIF